MRDTCGMQKLLLFALMSSMLVGHACSRSLHGGKDAAPDGASLGPGDRDAQTTDMPVSNTGGTAGMPETGGTRAGGGSGGVTNTGGATETGGTSATGGATETGGTSATGGANQTGGTSATGGTTGKGGASASGGTSATGGTTGMGGSRPLADGGYCADIAGNWRLTGSCYGPRAWFNGSFSAVLTQTGCNLSFTQIDDQGVPWTCAGRLENTGRGFLQGKFTFTDSSMCDLEITADGLDMRCASATQACTLQAREIL